MLVVLEAHFEVVEFAEVSRERKIFWGTESLILGLNGPWKTQLEVNEMSLAHSLLTQERRSPKHLSGLGQPWKIH